MKVAAVTDDGKTISQHFGRATHYAVLTVEDGRVTAPELREEWGHLQVLGQDGHEHGQDGRGHGFDAASQGRHGRMAAAIADWGAVLGRGMGAGAYQSMVEAGIRPIVTDLAGIDEAVQAYAEGRLVDHPERLH